MGEKKRRAAAKRAPSGNPELPSGRSGGVTNYGQIGNVAGDIVGGNKIEQKLDPEGLFELFEKKGYFGGLPIALARKIMEAFGERSETLSVEHIEQIFYRKAEEYRRLKERLASLSEDDPQVQLLRREASELVDAGDFTAADARLAAAEERDLISAIEHEEIAKRKRLSAAASRGARGDAATLRLAYSDAAGHYGEAVRISEPLGDVMQRWHWLHKQATAIFSKGHDFGDKAALKEAIERYMLLLDVVPRDRYSDEWAATQADLANALLTLGELGETAPLNEAVIACDNALKEWTRESNAVGWARVKSMLGLALKLLGEQDPKTRQLDESVNACTEALSELASEPFDWALTQNRLANALTALGERESGKNRFEKAIAAYKEVLREWTRERLPLLWALTQNNLGVACQAVGERESGISQLNNAIASYNEALKEFTQNRVPLLWARVQNNLSVSYRKLATREDDGTSSLQKAITAANEALKERRREYPLLWARTMNNLGLSLRTLGEHESDTGRLNDAILTYKAALKVLSPANEAFDWATTQHNLGDTLSILGKRGGSTKPLKDAAAAYREALKLWNHGYAPLRWATAKASLSIVLSIIGERENDTRARGEAAKIKNEVLEAKMRGILG
jgi:tetratricopeptide (TPR) repeat protein